MADLTPNDAMEISSASPWAMPGVHPLDRTLFMTVDLHKRSEALYGYAISPEEHKAIVAREKEMFQKYHHDDDEPLSKPKKKETT